MQNNLIINGIDHAKFCIEWAKLGGVVASEYKGINIHCPEKRIMKCSIVNDTFLRGYDYINHRDDVINLVGAFSDIYTFRMATPAECEAAGVDYVEKPVEVDDFDWFEDFERCTCFIYTILKPRKSKSTFYIKTQNGNYGFSKILFDLDEAKAWCVNDRIERLKLFGVNLK